MARQMYGKIEPAYINKPGKNNFNNSLINKSLSINSEKNEEGMGRMCF